MNIYLVRHGDAEPLRPGITDAQRALTEEGKALLTKAAHGWTKIVSMPDHIVSSPLRRAIQTAGIIKSAFGFEHEIILDNRIIGEKASYILELCGVLQGNNIFFVGHEPDFSNYVSQMISTGTANINFKKGMIAKISFNGKLKTGQGELEMLVPQKAYK